MTGLVNVMIVDDQAETRLGFALMLRRDPTLRLWGQAADGRQAVDAVDRATRAERPLPDVVLMDVRMPVMDGIDACALICERHPEVRVLILITYDEDDYAFGGLEAGASGSSSRTSAPASLLTRSTPSRRATPSSRRALPGQSLSATSQRSFPGRSASACAAPFAGSPATSRRSARS
ncbi:response regulator transcription factor [Tractidigestivibacter sp.]|uniref:response regulator n=1 Tax=Tractidigestivibacter sp. TaxID=2847320 RepID=UPI002A91A5C3|nr:response regulator transcription factor [Tractidigestivibacter sp.]MDY5271650.1 response regulator transcription factor [Tractidigestivibacter sp.]